ncbi:MAG: hypothetical protein R3E82_16125 [Pseudomonadales bacterium]
MSEKQIDVNQAFEELRKGSIYSLIFVVLGVAFLVGSVYYSATRLSPLEEQIRSISKDITLKSQELELKTKEIEKLENTRDFLESEANILRANKDGLLLEIQGLEDKLSSVKQKVEARDYSEAQVELEKPLPARVYIHIRSILQNRLAGRLAGKLSEAGIVVPDTSILVDYGPKQSQLRYFRRAESAEAQKIMATLQSGMPDVAWNLSYMEGFESSTDIRPLHFEVWLDPCKLDYDSAEWQSAFVGNTEPGTWHVFAETLPIGASSGEAEQRARNLDAAFPDYRFKVMSTQSSSQGNRRYAIVVAEGLRDAGLAKAIAKHVDLCEIAPGAYARQQPG